MNQLSALKDELAFLEKHLSEIEARPDLAGLAVEFKKRIDGIRQQMLVLTGKQGKLMKLGVLLCMLGPTGFGSLGSDFTAFF
jgi:hypothetical protein